jgi:aminoglycoside phosphotransferase (APT) family kinase protein
MSGPKMHDDEVHTDVALVRRLLGAQYPEWADLPIAPVASAGTDNALYRLGDDMAVRLPRIQWAVKLVEKEYEWLPRLAPLLPLAVPVPLAKGHPGEGYPWPWSVCRWVEGENPTVDRVPDPPAFATTLAHFVAVLHGIDPDGGPPAGEQNFFRGVPLAERDAWTRPSIESLRGTVDTDVVTAAWDAALAIPPWAGSSVWIHGDLSPGNLLCVDGRLRAVIDFGGLGVGDPACDVVVAWNLLPADARDVFRSAVPIDDATWARGRGWALSIALIQLPYYRDTNPALAANSRHVIDQVLADHRRAD